MIDTIKRMNDDDLNKRIEDFKWKSNDAEELATLIFRHAEDVYIPQLESLQKENEALKAKYDALVEGLKGLEVYCQMEIGEQVFDYSYVKLDEVNKLITDNGGKSETSLMVEILQETSTRRISEEEIQQGHGGK